VGFALVAGVGDGVAMDGFAVVGAAAFNVLDSCPNDCSGCDDEGEAVDNESSTLLSETVRHCRGAAVQMNRRTQING